MIDTDPELTKERENQFLNSKIGPQGVCAIGKDLLCFV